MTAISEKIELLGKGLYSNIPDTLTIKGLPTVSELEYVGSEDFDETMLDKILPEAIEEDIDCKQLLEIDFNWICRCIRILNFGPYYTTNAIFCDECGKASYGEYQVNLNSIACVPLPEGFVNDIKISREDFLDFNGDITLKLPTIRQMLNAQKDKAFQFADGRINRELARMCYMITSINGNANLTPVEIKLLIQKELSAADYVVIKDKIRELTNYGLRAGGVTQCPKCHGKGSFIALNDDKFFRPTLGDLRQWKHDRSGRSAKDVSRSKTTSVRKHN